MKLYSTTEARPIIGELINQVKYKKVIIALGRNNEAEALLTPIPTDYDFSITDINSASDSFSFLSEEPDLYSLDDLRQKYV